MIAVVDTSVILRLLFGEAEQLAEWRQIERAWASRLLPVELGRVIDRARLSGELDDVQVAALHVEARRVLKSIDLVAISERLLVRASSAMPTVLGTLDAIHLATALELAATTAPGVVLATHDVQLGRAARASQLAVVGVPGV